MRRPIGGPLPRGRQSTGRNARRRPGFRADAAERSAIDGRRKLWAGASHERADEVKPASLAEVDADLELVRQRIRPNERIRSPGVIHADLFPDNVFFLGEKLAGLIDFAGFSPCNDAYAYRRRHLPQRFWWLRRSDCPYNLTKRRRLLAGDPASGRVRSSEHGIAGAADARRYGARRRASC